MQIILFIVINKQILIINKLKVLLKYWKKKLILTSEILADYSVNVIFV